MHRCLSQTRLLLRVPQKLPSSLLPMDRGHGPDLSSTVELPLVFSNSRGWQSVIAERDRSTIFVALGLSLDVISASGREFEEILALLRV